MGQHGSNPFLPLDSFGPCNGKFLPVKPVNGIRETFYWFQLLLINCGYHFF